MDSITQTFRAKLFAGVATLLPLYLTYVVIRFLFESLEKMSGPILERFGLGIPGLGIILTIILIYLLGIIVTNFLGRKIFDLGESIVKRVPIVSMIYTTLKQITDTFTKGTTDAFDGVVYIHEEPTCRSTSNGDFVVVGQTKYKCARVGWEKV